MQKFIAKLSEKERKIFYVMALIVFAALVDRVFIGPALGKIAAIEGKISIEENSIKQDLKILSHKKNILAESKAFDKYYTFDLEDDDVINREFFRMIENLASQSKINLVKSNRSEPLKKEKYIEYYADLDCTGELNDVVTFMHAINSLDQLVKVSQFNMSPKRGTLNNVSASMTIIKMITNPSMVNEIDTP
jgi:Tfp pilus assembly protein PilO